MVQSEERIAKRLLGAYPALSEFEALQIAVGIRQNDLFEKAHAISSEDKTPPALEAIAIQLGFKTSEFSNLTLLDVLDNINDSVKDVAEILEKKFPQ